MQAQALPRVEGPPDAATFRRCMRGQAGTVAVITCGEGDSRTGLTATAVCPVTDAPPTVLVCVNAGASAHPVIRATGRFGVSFLAGDQQEIAGRFAGRGGVAGAARYDGAAWHQAPSGAPLLQEALVSFDCVLEAEHRHGSHSIFIGRIDAARWREDAAPLLYLDGRFGHFAVPPSA
ncbi:flavin reductase [Pseudoroseomonas deserti]|uniref:Flavin reductase n=1 Tax=Teichococcus deserti TaxID=1817963 RepID=A0A1V2GU34_9PROT|nr:flavin reductase family protein [Pseudoroseomonas deserti]ONG44620.1 flavin reductase [Pseudoroseomonas deserti]